MESLDTSDRKTGLLLTGGGARAAYQVGVLEAIADIRVNANEKNAPNPFPIFVGTSAGAINAAALACRSDNFDQAVRLLAGIWRNFASHQVYRSDHLSMARTGVKWLTFFSLGWLVTKFFRLRPKSLLDNEPLETLVRDLIPFDRLGTLINNQTLHALGITASSYSSGEHVTFFEGADGLAAWNRSQRFSVATKLSYEHLLASSAIPFVFPPKELTVDGIKEYFGDGSMRQIAPISGAIHLGASKVLVIGAGRVKESRHIDRGEHVTYSSPTLAQIAGHSLSSIFLDSLTLDIERVLRINQTIKLIPQEARTKSALREVELLVIAPSQRIDSIAARHLGDLPPAVMTMLGAFGVREGKDAIKSAALASYLLFESRYTSELMALGYMDAQNMKQEICHFFGWSQGEAS